MSKPNARLALPPEDRPSQQRMTAAEYREQGSTKKPRHATRAIPGPSPQDIVAALASKWPALPKLTIDLPTPPSLNNGYENNRGGGRRKSKKLLRFYSDATAALLQFGQRFDAETYRAHIVVTREDPRSDIDGRGKFCLDILVKCGIIPDDRFCERVIIEWRYNFAPGATVMLDRYKRRGHV